MLTIAALTALQCACERRYWRRESLEYCIGPDLHAEAARTELAPAACADRASTCKLDIGQRKWSRAAADSFRAAPFFVTLGCLRPYRTRAAAARPQSAGESYRALLVSEQVPA